MTLVEWATTLAAFAAVIGFIGAIVAKLIKGYADGVVKDYLSELKPNSGSSLRDEVKSIKSDVEVVRRNVAKLEGKFEQHISESIK